MKTIIKKGVSIIELVIVTVIIGILLETIITLNKGIIKKSKVNAYFNIMDKITYGMCPNYILSHAKGNLYLDKNKISVPTVQMLEKIYHFSFNDPFYKSLIKKQPTIKYSNGNCIVNFQVDKKLFQKYKSLPILHSQLIEKDNGNKVTIELFSPVLNGISAAMLREGMFYQYIDRGVIYPGTFQKEGNAFLKQGTDIVIDLPGGYKRTVNRFKDGKGRIANRNQLDLEELPYYDKKKHSLKPIPSNFNIINTK